MDPNFVTIMIAAGVVIAGTFVLRTIMGNAIKLGGLAAVAFFAKRAQEGAEGFMWLERSDLMTIVGAALFGYIIGLVMNVLVFREDGFGRHFFVPLIGVGAAYGSALLLQL